jgi:N-acetylmuramic acid 6-phosphate (MurNAc-6-P) etherase
MPAYYGVPSGLVIAVIAGGDKAITTSIENAKMTGSRDGKIFRF